MTSRLLPAIALLVLAAVPPCRGEVYTFADFTRPANAASLTESFDFIDGTTSLPEGWTGFPLNIITFYKRGASYGCDLTYIIETSETLASGSLAPVVTHGPELLGTNPTISHTFSPGPR